MESREIPAARPLHGWEKVSHVAAIVIFLGIAGYLIVSTTPLANLAYDWLETMQRNTRSEKRSSEWLSQQGPSSYQVTDATGSTYTRHVLPFYQGRTRDPDPDPWSLLSS